MRNLARLLACGLLLSCLAQRAFAQTCDPTVVRLSPTGPAVADLRESIKGQPLVVTAGAYRFVADWDQPTSLTVSLRGISITPAQLSGLELADVRGFRFTPDAKGTYPQPTAQGCIGHYQFGVTRVWRVRVSVPESKKPIVVQVQPDRQSAVPGPQLETPSVIPPGAPQDDPVQDWDVPLNVTIYPVSGDRQKEYYTFELRATDFARPECGRSTPGIKCHDREDIERRLSRNKKRGNSWAEALIHQRNVVTRIEFELQNP